MNYPDIDELPIADLREEARLRANVLENLKVDKRFAKHSFDRVKIQGRIDMARENLKDVLDEISLRQGLLN